jgi:hypothetical protein
MRYDAIMRVTKARGVPNTYWVSLIPRSSSPRSSSNKSFPTKAVKGSEKAAELVMRGYPLLGATTNERNAARAEICKRIFHAASSSFPVRISAKHEDPLMADFISLGRPSTDTKNFN